MNINGFKVGIVFFNIIYFHCFISEYQHIYINIVETIYDDSAGQKATAKAISVFNNFNINIRVVDLTPYKDPDDFIKNLGAEEFENRKLKRSDFL